MIADICREPNKFMITLNDDIRKFKDDSKLVMQATRNAIKNLQMEYKGELDE